MVWQSSISSSFFVLESVRFGQSAWVGKQLSEKPGQEQCMNGFKSLGSSLISESHWCICDDSRDSALSYTRPACAGCSVAQSSQREGDPAPSAVPLHILQAPYTEYFKSSRA